MSDSNSLSKYKSNQDIEQVLSESYSISSKDKPLNNNIIINKIGSPLSSVKSGNSRDKIIEKLELSSNKEIDVGLDLLINKEKINKKNSRSQPEKDAVSVEEKSVLLDNNNIDIHEQLKDVDSITRIESMVNDLNSENISRLSQDEIDKIIDKKDHEDVRLRAPLLVSAEEIQQTLRENVDDRSNSSSRSVLLSSPVTPSNKNLDSKSDVLSKKSNKTEKKELSVESINYRRSMRDKLRKQKQEILFKLDKMKRLGIQGIKSFNMSSDLAEMEDELNRVKKEREIESSIKFQRKCLMAVVTGAELLNNKFDFLDFKLDGWSEQVHENIDEYNEVFEELHEKYKEKAKMAPEIKLMFMLGGSAFMYHVTNSMFKNSIPGMEDIMKQNPDLMKQFANAAINQINDPEERNAAEFMYNNSQSSSRPTHSNNFSNQKETTTSVHSDVHNLTKKMVSKNNLDVSSDDKISIESTNSNIRQNRERVVNTPFNMASKKISPPSGVDEILDELRSNTEKESSRSSENDVSIGNYKSNRPNRVNNKFNLSIP